MEFKFELGAEVKSIMTGFRGVILSRTEHISGVNEYKVVPKGNDLGIGERYLVQRIDEWELELVKKSSIKKNPSEKIVRYNGKSVKAK